MVQKLVITTKSVEYMPFFLSLFSFLNGVTWTAYALIQFDPYIAVRNFVLLVYIYSVNYLCSKLEIWKLHVTSFMKCMICNVVLSCKLNVVSKIRNFLLRSQSSVLDSRNLT